jgi:SHS family lactate transporter-like MFS transporter
VIPAHLNELSPPEIRATFPGFVYQLGNLLAAVNLNLQVAIAESHGNNYGMAMAVVIGTVAVAITLLVALGPERRGVPMSAAQERTHAQAHDGTYERSLAAGRPP